MIDNQTRLPFARRYALIYVMARAHPQVVLITGATSAIGRSLAHDLFRTDCRLILCARNDHDLEQLKTELISAARNGILLF